MVCHLMGEGTSLQAMRRKAKPCFHDLPEQNNAPAVPVDQLLNGLVEARRSGEAAPHDLEGTRAG
jgi:hypothetical protein